MDDTTKHQPATTRDLSLYERIQNLAIDVGHVAKDGRNPHYDSTFASLPQVLNTITPKLKEHGITMVQEPSVEYGGDGQVSFFLRTTLRAGKEQTTGIYLLSPTKPDPQGYASALTYARRYSILTMLGLPTEDDNGNTASNLNGSDRKAQSQRSPGRSTSPPGGPPPNEDSERAAIQADSGTMDDWGGYVCRFGKKYKGKTLTQIGLEDAKSYGNYIASLANKKGESVSGPAAEFIEAVKAWMAQDPADGVFDG